MKKPPPSAVVIFGATGDLTHRKLVPALFNLYVDGYLPQQFCIVGVARTKQDDQHFRDGLLDACQKYSRQKVDLERWNTFAQTIFYQSVNAEIPADFVALKTRLDQIEKTLGTQLSYLHYLSTAPQFFGPIVTNLRAADLIVPPAPGSRGSAVIVEKPFGHDLDSARELNHTLRQSCAENQIFRIDHYLGKETVQNILTFRFANGIFEPLWNRYYVDHIQISVCECIGVGNRAGYFEQSGIIRDIIQNHLLQMLALLCIEPPGSLSDPDSIRDEKVKVLKSMKRFTTEQVLRETVRAGYAEGIVDGQSVPGYRSEKGVAPGSMTDTYLAMCLEIDNWRWSGVPIYVRAGKRLPKRITEITVFFKKPPSIILEGKPVELEQNVLAIQVQPVEGISLKILSKPPGPRMTIMPVEMDFNYGSSFGVASADAYERLLLDAMNGNPTLFTRDDEIEQAWELLAPVFAAWKDPTHPVPLASYPAGTWGPEEAVHLLARRGHSWRSL